MAFPRPNARLSDVSVADGELLAGVRTRAQRQAAALLTAIRMTDQSQSPILPQSDSGAGAASTSGLVPQKGAERTGGADSPGAQNQANEVRLDRAQTPDGGASCSSAGEHGQLLAGGSQHTSVGSLTAVDPAPQRESGGRPLVRRGKSSW